MSNLSQSNFIFHFLLILYKNLIRPCLNRISDQKCLEDFLPIGLCFRNILIFFNFFDKLLFFNTKCFIIFSWKVIETQLAPFERAFLRWYYSFTSDLFKIILNVAVWVIYIFAHLNVGDQPTYKYLHHFQQPDYLIDFLLVAIRLWARRCKLLSYPEIVKQCNFFIMWNYKLRRVFIWTRIYAQPFQCHFILDI